MIKNLVQFESKIGEFLGHFNLPQNTPIDIAEQMLLQWLQYLGKVKDQVKANEEAAKSQEQAPSPDINFEEPKPAE